MTGFDNWLPVVIVLLGGLAVGLGLAFFRLRKAGPKSPRTEPAATEAPPLSKSTAGGGQEPVAAPAPTSSVKGFVWGVLTTAVIGGLVFWALRNPAPSPPASEGSTAVQSPASDSPSVEKAHGTNAGMTSEDQAAVANLRAALEADPTNIGVRKQLALRLVQADQLVVAFDEASEILQAQPNDPDGLYVQAVVRLAMGQAGRTVELADRVIQQYPQHRLALMLRGRAYERMGQLPMAIASWERALAAAGGSHPEIERLISMARSRGGADPGAQMGAGPELDNDPFWAPEPTSAPAAAADSGARYRLRIELGANVRQQRGATLFVSLRGDPESVPVAARKIENPTFPVELELSHADSMMGAALPMAGTITVRLDSDGNALTQPASDPSARAEVKSGEDRIALALVGGQP